MTPERLAEIKADARNQFDNQCGWREISTRDFLDWIDYMKDQQLNDEIPIKDYDVLSVMSWFEQWVKEDK